MPKSFNQTIIDTSCFILLEKIGELDLIRKVFQSEIVTTDVVATEFKKELPEWVSVKQVENERFFTFLESEVDSGEASVIALAFEQQNSLLILDDLKARNLAMKLQLDYTGTLGLILKAKQLNIISLIGPIMHKIQQTNFRFSKIVLKEILDQAGE